MLSPTPDIPIQELSDPLLDQKNVRVFVLRLDIIHPVASGNKLFKLHHFLQQATSSSYEGIITYGGAYSNHLVATAYLCREARLKCIGIVRGESPAKLSPTLTACINYGMSLKFISRQDYLNRNEPAFLNKIMLQNNKYLHVPEGGFHPDGAAGASMIMDLVPAETSHIVCAIGTATTLAGLLQGIKKDQTLVGIPVLKNMQDIPERIAFLTNENYDQGKLKVVDDYHFGGYAKKSPELLDFINHLYQVHGLPTDFVYTGKMMFATIECIKENFFPPGSKIVCIHTGGLQGNSSLPAGSLVFN